MKTGNLAAMIRLLSAGTRYAIVFWLLFSSAMAVEPEQKKPRVKNIKGKVKEVSESRLLIVDAKNEAEIELRIRPRLEIDVLGISDTAYLTPGVNVHFLAEMNKSGFVQTPLPEITVCDITEREKALCILADPTKASNKGPEAMNVMEVRGPIKTNKNGRLTIEIKSQAAKNNQQIKITLAPDVKVLVHLSDLSCVQRGDDVEVPQATELGPALLQPSKKLTVRLANPLVAAKKPPPGGKTTATSK